MRFTMTREMYLTGKDSRLHYADAARGIEVYYYERNGRACAIAFVGRANKPYYNYAYTSEDKRDMALAATLKSLDDARAAKETRRIARATFKHSLQVGNILCASWGYEQTNIDYYQVIAVKGASVIIREIAQDKEHTHWLAGNTKPRANAFIDEPMIKRVGMGNAIRFESYKTAYPCTPDESRYFSEYA